MKDYGKAIKILRKKNNLTQMDLAEELSISAQAVSKWENNLAQPDFDTIVKMTEIFNVTMDEFAQICATGTIAATPIAAEGNANATEISAPKLIGVCTCCGSSLHSEEEVGERAPKLICKSCKQEIERKNKAEADRQAAQRAGEHREQVKKFRWTLITPAIIAIIIMVLGIVCAAEYAGVYIVIGVLLYLALAQVFWDNNFIADIFDWTFGKTFAKPGLIIPLSLDGFIWALCVKVAMAIIWFFLSLIVTLIGLVLCCLFAPFSFVFMLKRTLNELENNEFMPDTFTDRFFE